MRTKQIGALVGVAAMTLTVAGTAAAQPAKKPAKTPAMTTVTKTLDAEAPQALVDSSGTVNVVWIRVNSTGGGIPTYGRKPAAAKRFTTVTLPGASAYDDDPFIFAPSRNVLDILAEDNSSKIVAWRSTNDGKSWASVNTDSLNTSIAANGQFIVTSVLFEAPGGPIGAAENGAILQFNSALTAATPVGTAMAAMSNPDLARSSSGTVFQLGWGDVQSSVSYQAGTHAGTMTFPACPASAPDPSGVFGLAAGKSTAVALEAACGHVYARSISASGAVGSLVKLGQAVSHDATGVNGNGNLWGDVAAASNGDFTATWIGPAGDVQVARSSNGTKWSVQKKLVPVAYARVVFGTDEVLAAGNPTWYFSSQSLDATNNNLHTIRGIPLTDDYTSPGSPSAHGISHPKRYRMGALAATATGLDAFKAYRKHRRYTVRLVDALSETVTINLTDSRTVGEDTYDVCGGTVTPKLKAHKVKTVTVVCAPPEGTPIKKKDDLTVQILARNGTITVPAKVS